MKPMRVICVTVLLTCCIVFQTAASPRKDSIAQGERTPLGFAEGSSSVLRHADGHAAHEMGLLAAHIRRSGRPMPEIPMIKDSQNLDRNSAQKNNLGTKSQNELPFLRRAAQEIGGEKEPELLQQKTAELSGLLKRVSSSEMTGKNSGSLSSEALAEKSASRNEKNSSFLNGKESSSGSSPLPKAGKVPRTTFPFPLSQPTAASSREETDTDSEELAEEEAEYRDVQKPTSPQDVSREEADEETQNARGSIHTQQEQNTPSPSDVGSSKTRSAADVAEEQLVSTSPPKKALQDADTDDGDWQSVSSDSTGPKGDVDNDETTAFNRTRRGTDMLSSESHSYYTSSETCREKTRTSLIRIRGCIPRRVRNSSCEGTCHSRSVPQWDIDRQELVHVAYCTCCKPYQLSYQRVTFRCPGRARSVAFYMGIATQCACRPCSDGNPKAAQPYDY